MSSKLINEAARRGRNEAARRELQHNIDKAYNDEVEAFERKRQKERQRASNRQAYRANVTDAWHRVFYGLLNYGWPALLIYLGYTKAWEEFRALDNYFYGQEWQAYVALAVAYLVGRPILLSLFGYKVDQ